MPDLDTRQHDARQSEQPEQAAPVRRAMLVGAADDHAELDADRRADEALSWLATREPVDLTGPVAPEAHVHSAACGVSRSHAPAADATIGYEGGALDEATQSEIEGAVGGGEGLAAPLRSAMEGAFGRDLGKVRVHRDARAARISRSISAEAFTTGNDIFFGAGAYDPASAPGQRVLAHELGHVVQGAGSVRRWNPLKKKKAGPPKVGPLTRDETIKQNRSDMKHEDTSARAEAKQVNADHKALTTKVKLSYECDPTAKLFTPAELAKLQARFENKLKLERMIREAVKRDNPGLAPDALAAKQEEAAENVWNTAAPEIRALRPLRFDEFDKALNEVAELSRQGREEKAGMTSKALADNERYHGAPMDPAKAEKQVTEQRAMDRRKARIQSGQSPEQIAADQAASKDAQLEAENATGNGMVGPRQATTVRGEAAKKHDKATYGPDEDLESARSGLATGGKVVSGAGGASKSATKQSVKRGLATAGDGTEISELTSGSFSGLGQLLSLVSEVLQFVSQVSDIKQGAADNDAGVQVVRQGAATLNSATKLTKTTLELAKEGVSTFGGVSTVVGQASTAIPIVGLISSALGAIDSGLGLIPVLDKHAMGLVSVEEAVLARKAPLAASFDRVNSRTAQLIEKGTFGLAKNITMLGLNIAEVGTAGGFGVPAAAKTAIMVTDLLHTAGHKIYDTVMESKASTALKGFKVQHKESASRNVLKYDVGSSIDVIIVAAQKHKLDYARMTLEEYGIRDSEIDSMWLEEIREKVLNHLDTTGDPKTVGEKVTAAKESVKSALGVEKTPTGMGEDTTTLEKIASVPGKVSGAITALPGKIRAKYQSMKDKFADAKQIVETKNSQYSGGRDDRGKASTLFYAMRGADKNEKSLAKVRTIMADRGTATENLPRSTDDRKKRAELEAARDTKPDDRIGAPLRLDPAFVQKVVAATSPELFALMSSIDDTAPIAPLEMAKMRFLEMEVQARITQPGAQPMPGPRKG